MSTKAELLAKIRKCLALAKSANEHEAAAALAKARELMDAHGVDHADIAFLDIGEADARGSRAQRPARWETTLVAAVTLAIPCRSFINERLDRTFVGLTPAPEIAAYAFRVLHRQLKRARAEYIGKQLRRCSLARKRKRADIFCEGWAHAVFSKIERLYPRQPENELVGKYLVEKHPGLVTINTRSAKISGRGASDDFWRGYDRGREAELNHGVAGSEGPRLLEGAAT